MARTRALSDLILDVRRRTCMENSELVSDDELTEILNQELAELHAHLVMNEGQPHFRTQYNISVVAGTSLYALPAAFWKLQRLTAMLDGYNCDLAPFMEGERAGLQNSNIYGYVARGNAPMYRVQASNLEILPSTRAFTATLFYIQRSPRLVGGADTVDGFNGYEVAAIYGTCATILQKEESDPSYYSSQKDRILRFIDSVVASRDASHPERVTDVTGGLDSVGVGYPWGGW